MENIKPKYEFTHITSSGYFRRRVVLSAIRNAGLSIFPKIHRSISNQTNSRSSSQSDQKLDYGDRNNQFLR